MIRSWTSLALTGALLSACGGGEPDGQTDASTTDATTSATGTTTGASTSSTTGSTTGSTGAGTTGTTGTTTGGPVEPTVIFPRTSILPQELGVLVNDDDPQSVAVAEYYLSARQIPAENLVHLSFSVGNVMTVDDFDVAMAEVDLAFGDDIQALALTWTTPYRVDCMSVTTAFAVGYDTIYCNTSGMACGETAAVDTYDSSTLTPFTDHGIRPTMMLAGDDVTEIQALVDRGVAADGTFPFAEGYLIRTTDSARSVRYPIFQETVDLFDHEGGLSMTYIDNADGSGSNVITGKTDVLFYFTGLASVPDIATNTYLPGAIADHLTSFGGQVPTSGQMSIVQWLKAGATGSYGTVVEPCNFLAKFPDTNVVTSHYFRGQTLVEAYWKSVRWPGEGLFVGEPLARPWAGHEVTWDPVTHLLSISTTMLEPGVDYDIEAGPTDQGPWTHVATGSVPHPVYLTFEIPDATSPYYRIVPVP